MNKIVKIEYVKCAKNSEVETKHTLTTTINNDIVHNKKRLQSHCYSLGRKTFGNNCVMMKIVTTDGEVLYEKQR